VLASTTSAPVARTCSGVIAFTAPWVPTGMKAGVWTGPWGVEKRPARASPARPWRAKRKGGSDATDQR
jgi:hypothetical protein